METFKDFLRYTPLTLFGIVCLSVTLLAIYIFGGAIIEIAWWVIKIYFM